MKKLLLSVAAATIAASFFIACSSSGLSSADVNNLINGPNSLKGTITGTMMDNTPYSFDYDYHVTTNDGNSYTESWIENGDNNYTGDSILYIYQYFYVDKSGYADNGDGWSPSGRYVRLEFYVDMASLKLMPTDYSSIRLSGMWQNPTASGNRFVYGLDFRTSNNSGTLDITGMKYDKGTQILTGKLNLAMPDNHTNSTQFENNKATTITGDFKIFVPKENFQITKASNNYGQVYRKRG